MKKKPSEKLGTASGPNAQAVVYRYLVLGMQPLVAVEVDSQELGSQELGSMMVQTVILSHHVHI